MNISIIIAQAEHFKYAQEICDTIELSVLRGTGIAKKNSRIHPKKMENKDAVIALDNGKLAGFCYIESWQESNYVVLILD
jgi:hypothetical protein